MNESHHHDVVVVGAGVSGIYQIKRLVDLGLDAILLEATKTWAELVYATAIRAVASIRRATRMAIPSRRKC